MAEEITVPIRADTAPFEQALENLKGLSESFGSQLTGALKSAAVSGKSLDDVLRRIALNLAGMALEQGLKPLQSLAGSLFSGLCRGSAGCSASPRAASCRSPRAAWCRRPPIFRWASAWA